jgi:hypothetical protein
MKITEVRTRVVEWSGEIVPPQPRTCTNPVDLLDLPTDAMRSFRFHSWLLVEIMTDSGHTGIGEAALAPRVTKQVIDLNLKPILIGQNPFDSEYLWQHMYRSTLAFGRKGIGMVAISAVDIGIWDLLGKIQNQPLFRLLGGKTKPKIPVYASRLYSQPLLEIAHEARGAATHEAAINHALVRARFVLGSFAEGLRLLLGVVGQLVFENYLDFVVREFIGRNPRPLLEHHHPEACCREFFGQHSSCGAGTDNGEVNLL